MDLDDGSLSSYGNKEAIMAAYIATATVILNMMEEEVVVEEERRSIKAQKLKYGGSRLGKAPNLKRDFSGAYKMVVEQ